MKEKEEKENLIKVSSKNSDLNLSKKDAKDNKLILKFDDDDNDEKQHKK
jgi:hypothetical protein